eukprot:354315_1
MRTVNDPIPTNIAIMASLDEVIRFRASVDKLTGTEFDQFILTLMQKCGRDIIITSLFTMFTSERNRSSQTLDTTLNIIKQIIESRKTKPKPANSYEITMQSLPSALIGNLASYLYFTDYESFQTVNRTVYIGCNTPNTLRRLDLSQINDYSQINLAKYLHLNKLSIRFNAFISNNAFVLPANGETVCNRLRRIAFDGANQTDVDISNFITSQNIINTNNITYLRCTRFGHGRTHFSFDAFTQFLLKFPNIEHLSLVAVALPSVPDIQSSLLQSLPHLQGVTWLSSSSAFLVEILTAFGSKLKALKFRDRIVAPMPNHITFSHLEQLMILSPQIATLDHILKTAKNLRKIVLYFNRINSTFSIDKLLATQPLLEYVGVHGLSYRDVSNSICNGIEHGLYNREHKNKYIKLNMDLFLVGDIDITTYKRILFMIVKITNQLRTLDVEHFMIIITAKRVLTTKYKTHKWMRKEFSVFEQKHSDMRVYHGTRDFDYYIIVSNVGCAINGRVESFVWDNS